LKSADFFDAENHPSLKFTSTEVKKVSDDALEIAGHLEIKGQVKPVVLTAEFAGIAVDPYGQTKAGMTIHGSIKRSEFGLTWSAVTEAGNVVVGDEIKLNAELQFIKQ
jgi:polyisoprenoid-binding protein YceI